MAQMKLYANDQECPNTRFYDAIDEKLFVVIKMHAPIAKNA
jgi:hypothetical protein